MTSVMLDSDGFSGEPGKTVCRGRRGVEEALVPKVSFSLCRLEPVAGGCPRYLVQIHSTPYLCTAGY